MWPWSLISDITTASGLALRNDIYNGKFTKERLSTTHQVYQEKPTNTLTWTLWRKACNLLIHHRHTKKLLQPLGDWTVHFQSLHQNHYLYSPTTNSIYRQANQQWYEHQQHPTLPYRYHKSSSETTHPPNDSFPVDIKLDSNTTFRCILLSTLSIPNPPPTPEDNGGVLSPGYPSCDILARAGLKIQRLYHTKISIVETDNLKKQNRRPILLCLILFRQALSVCFYIFSKAPVWRE